MMSELTTTLEWAKHYVHELGFSVIPLKPRGKKPVGKWTEFQDRKPNDEELASWFGDGKKNIGIVTGTISQLTVIDIDGEKGLSVAKDNGWMETATVRTGRDGGYHLYCRDCSGTRNFQNREEFPEIDLRGEGGYVVAPPSIHPNGNKYEWVKSTLPIQLMELPELLKTSKQEKLPIEELMAGVPEGGRNEALTRLVGVWQSEGKTDEEIKNQAAEWNEQNTPPLLDNEVAKVIESISKHMEANRQERQDAVARKQQYPVDVNGNVCCYEGKGKNTVIAPLSNFTCEIVKEVAYDDGCEKNHFYEIEARINKQKPLKVTVPAQDFYSMGWTFKLGCKATISAGIKMREKVRHYIQTNSNAEKQTCYTHTGWRKIDNHWTYLSAGGGIGSKALVSLPGDCSIYKLPETPTNEKEAIRASLSFLDIAEKKISIPLLTLLYLSPLTSILNPQPNFSGYLYGASGSFKSTLAALLLAHFGKDDGISKLSNFGSTANQLEVRGFVLKDMLMVLDDYHPSTEGRTATLMESSAQRLIRSFSNRTGRGRLRPDATEKPVKAPRSMLLITGEELVSNLSTQARILLLEVEKGMVNQERLSALQNQQSLLPHAMTSFLLWVKENIEKIKEDFSEEFRDVRDMVPDEIHGKLREQISFMLFAYRTFLKWLRDKEVIDEAEASAMKEEAHRIFSENAQKQSRHLAQESPITIFKEIVETLITQDKVQLKYRKSDRHLPKETTMGNSCATLIGYYDDDYLYFLPNLLWHEMQAFCKRESTHFPVKKGTLYRLLKSHGHVEAEKTHTAAQLKVDGKNHRALKVRRNLFESLVTVK